MIIWGWGKQTRKDFGSVIPLKCSHFNNSVYFHLVRIRTWFTLFFIPIIPYKNVHYLLCTICDYGTELDHNQIKKTKEMLSWTEKYIGGAIKEQAYLRLVDSFNLDKEEDS